MNDMLFFSLQVAIIGAFLYWLYNYVHRIQNLWSDLGVPGPKNLFLIGSEWELAIKSWPELTVERMKKYGKTYGTFNFFRPILYIHDAEIIKQVLIKDFHCFANRLELRTYHEVMNENLVFTDYRKWKRMRTIASPSFTTGKLKKTSPIMNKCVDKLFKYMDKTIEESAGIIDTKKVIAGFTMDVIASAGFSTSLKVNNNREFDDPFLTNGLNLFKPNPFRAVLALTFPRPILTFLGIRTFNPPEAIDYFIKFITELIKKRKLSNFETNDKPHDLLQLMLDAEADEKELNNDNYENLSMDNEEKEFKEIIDVNETAIKNKLTENEVIANCIFFLIGGFETTSSAISHAMFELARNPGIQEKLHNQLKKALDGIELDSIEYYDLIMRRIEYLDAVVNETLRMYPSLTTLTRRVTVDQYELEGIPLKRDLHVNIPAHAVHYCEEYYENPYQFDPDRFLLENKHKLTPYTYLPFGIGPRNCIGMRFALQEVKICLSRIIMDYHVGLASDTPQKLKFASRSPLLQTEQFNLKISKR